MGDASVFAVGTISATLFIGGVTVEAASVVGLYGGAIVAVVGACGMIWCAVKLRSHDKIVSFLREAEQMREGWGAAFESLAPGTPVTWYEDYLALWKQRGEAYLRSHLPGSELRFSERRPRVGSTWIAQWLLSELVQCAENLAEIRARHHH